MAQIIVDSSQIADVLIGTEWVGVLPGSLDVDFAEYQTGPTQRFARGLHVSFTVQGGPHNGDTIVLPLGQVTAVRVTP